MNENITITGFSDEISTDTVKQFEHLNMLGIKYFDPRGVDGKNISSLNVSETAALKEKMDKFGIKAACIGSPIGKIKITDDFSEHLNLLKNTIKIAKTLKTRYIRIFSFYIPKGRHEEFRDEVMRRMKIMSKTAEEEGVILLHENEKGIYGDTAKACADILKTVNSPALGCIFDPANFVQCAQPVFPEAYELLKPYITYLHIKDATADGTVVPAGMGIGNVKEVILGLLKSGFCGFACLEPHLGSFEGFQNLELGDDMLKLKQSDGGMFTIAYNALRKILNEVSD